MKPPLTHNLRELVQQLKTSNRVVIESAQCKVILAELSDLLLHNAELQRELDTARSDSDRIEVKISGNNW